MIINDADLCEDIDFSKVLRVTCACLEEYLIFMWMNLC